MAIFKSVAEAVEGVLAHEAKPLAHVGREVSELREAASVLRAGRTVEEIPSSARMFHGTGTAWEGHAMGPISKGVSRENLYGPGLYMTHNRGVGLEYAGGKELVDDPHLYGFRWKETPNLIDLQTPLPDEVLDEMMVGIKGSPSGGGMPGILNKGFLKAQPGHEAYGMYKDAVTEEEMLGLTQRLRGKGYHGFSHEGGHVYGGGGGPHHIVNIAFDPLNDVQMVGRSAVEPEALAMSIKSAEEEVAKGVKVRAHLEASGELVPASEEVFEKARARLAGLKQQRAAAIRTRVEGHVAESMEARAAGMQARGHSTARNGLPTHTQAQSQINGLRRRMGYTDI